MITTCGLREAVKFCGPFCPHFNGSQSFATTLIPWKRLQQLIPIRRPVPRGKSRDNTKLGHNSSLAHLLQLMADCGDYDYITCIGVCKMIS